MSTITYRFFPAVDSANGMPRKTEFPYESVDPFTVPSCSFKLTLADPFAAASGIGLPLTRGTCPTKRPNERLWRAIIKAAGVLIVVNRGMDGRRKVNRLGPSDSYIRHKFPVLPRGSSICRELLNNTIRLAVLLKEVRRGSRSGW
jgi:hypothetical protein